VPPAGARLDELHRRGLDVQMVLLCGKSAVTERDVAGWATAHPQARVRLLPYNANVGQIMRCVSAVVARPGTGTTSEAIISGCPLLLNGLGGVMPQEHITVKFCLQHGVARLIRNPRQLADIVAKWKDNPELPAQFRQAMRVVCPPTHPRDIIRTVSRLGQSR